MLLCMGYIQSSILTLFSVLSYLFILRCMVAALQIGRSLVRTQLASLEIFIAIKSFRSHYDPGVDSASNRNEYEEHFLGVKAADA